MKIEKIAEILSAKLLVVESPDIEISGGYAGDFLSNVMSKAPSGCCWFTVMNNQNVAAVATLAEIGAVVLCEGVAPDNALLEKARTVGVNLLSTELDVFAAVSRIADAGSL